MLNAITNARIYTGKEVITGKTLLFENGKIVSIVSPESVPSDATVYDYTGQSVAPGLIDLQIAGAGGCLFSSSPTPDALSKITDSIIKSGTTSFLISIPTNSEELYRQAFRTIKENPHQAVMGIHLEGPYISVSKRGAHIREMIRKPSIKDVTDLISEANGVIRMITLAPEVCNEEIINILLKNKIVLAAGHSNATFKEASDGFKRGIKTVTHLFNAMSQLHHRDTGLPGAAFLSDTAYANIIADGIHVDFNMLSLSKKIMKERLYLVSDAVEETSNGAYKHILLNDRYMLHDGTLSGAKLTLLEAVKNCTLKSGIPLDEALRMASSYPAKVMDINDRGYLLPGYKADMLVFNEYYQCSGTWINGLMC